jgi:hypothetical protein
MIPYTKEGHEMRMSLMDRSLYYKGLMLLIRKDREIHDEEKRIMMAIGETLGFDAKFCENAIKEILTNKPQFSKPAIARCFIKDGLKVCLVDNEAHETELAWLKAVAEENGLDYTWYKTSVETASCQTWIGIEDDLEVKRLEWE